ncbi:MAG: hypothetical protein E7508_02475 [Ruminococcus sp.]|nr:hypothetical protein [Ruminococcus sp.]
MFKKIIKTFMFSIMCLSALYFTGCMEKYPPDNTIEERHVWEEKSFSSPDEENELVVRIYGTFFDTDSPQPQYAFYWRDGTGVSEMLACCETKRDDFDIEIDWKDSKAEIKAGVTTEDTAEFSLPYPDKSIRTQTVAFEMNNEDCPQIKAIEVTADCTGNIENKGIAVECLYSKESYLGETVGIIGVPYTLSYTGEIENIQLTFVYDEEKLKPIPEKNIMVLYNDNTNMAIDDLPFRRDYDIDRITVLNARQGTYMLDDAYVWRKTWNKNTYGYEYEGYEAPTVTADPLISSDPVDFSVAADVAWAKENAPRFYVSTPQQLAGAAYYVNNLAQEGVYISLQNDIDLGSIKWKPMGEHDGEKSVPVTIDGNGYCIYNLSVSAPEKNEVGFIGYADGLEVKNLSFENASVDGKNYVGILCGMAENTKSVENVNVSGKITVEGKHCGGITGDDLPQAYKNCTSDVSINGAPTTFLTHRTKSPQEEIPELPYTLTLEPDYRIRRTNGTGDLGWMVYVNGKQTLHRNAENESVLDTNSIDVIKPQKCHKYLIYLTSGTNQRVSNVIEYEVPVDYDNTIPHYTYSEEDSLNILQEKVDGELIYKFTKNYGDNVYHCFMKPHESDGNLTEWYAVEAYSGECFRREPDDTFIPL